MKKIFPFSIIIVLVWVNIATAKTYNSTDVPKDLGFFFATSTINISDTFSIPDVNVTIDITYPYVGDLDIYIQGPDGTEVELSTGNGGGGSNYTNTTFDDEASTPITSGSPPFTGSFRPEEPLSAFDGKTTKGTWTLHVDWGDFFGTTLNSWSLTISSSKTYNSTDVPKDLGFFFATSTINISDTFSIPDVNVTIDITYPYVGDLDIYIQGPDGTEVELSTGNGGGGSNYTNTTFDDEASTSIVDGSPPFTGSFRPEEPLSAFDGKTTKGTWTLHVDWGDFFGTTLNSWSLTISSPSIITVSKATDFGGGSTSPGTENVRFLQLGVVADSGTANITGVKAKFTGTSSAVNSDISAFDVYEDENGNGEIDVEDDRLGTVSSPTLESSATVTGLSFGVTTTTKYLLLVLDIAGGAEPSHTAGLELTDASFITSVGLVSLANFPIKNDSDITVTLPLAPRALSLDGDGDYVECGTDGSLSITDEMTVEAWVKVSSSFPADLRVGNIIGNYPHSPNFNFEGHRDGRLRLWWNNGERDVYAPDFDMRDDTWHHVVVTRNKKTDKIIFYTDGNSNGEYSAGSNADYHWPLRIGGDFRNTPGIPFQGLIDEVRIWNVARTQEEIRADINQPIENPELLENLVGYWNFDDGTADDLSQYGNHGTLQGGAEIVPLYGTWPPPKRGDVSGDNTISAYDAALILQFVVGLIDEFPVDLMVSPSTTAPRNYVLSLPSLTVKAGDRIQAPIAINDATGLVAGGITLKFNPNFLKPIKATPDMALNGAFWKANLDLTGEVRFAFASASKDASYDIKGQSNLLVVEFEVLPNTEGETSPLILDNITLSDSLTITKINGSVTVLTPNFALLQNFPNPFNPETWIPFDLAADASVTIRIYDVKGQLVRQLDIGKQKAGRYLDKNKAAYWNGKDQFGQSVSSGIYFYTLKAGSFMATRRMVILK